MAKISQGPYPASVPVDHPTVSVVKGQDQLKQERDARRVRKGAKGK